jgi:hypothetical protein
MDCRTARLLLGFAGRVTCELDPAETGALQAHLQDCPECAPLADAERRLDEHLGRVVRDVPVPEGLRAAVLTRLAGERDAFYRRWLVRAAGVAALVLVLAWLGWRWLGRPPALDPGEVAQAAQEQRQFANVQRWLQEIDRRLTAPPDFNYVLLAGYELAEVKGRLVPCLTFVRGEHDRGFWARVYVVGDRQFNLEGLTTPPGGNSHGELHVQVLTNDDNPQVRYVVVFTGDEVTPFLKPEQPHGPVVTAGHRAQAA